MKLSEIAGKTQLHEKMEHDGYSLRHEVQHEADDDNHKLWHHITPPGGKEEVLDHTPYQSIDGKALQAYAGFHKRFKRFPTRKDISLKSVGPLDNDSVKKLSQHHPAQEVA